MQEQAEGAQQTNPPTQPERDAWDQNTRIFCAEQIVVPLELPEILKAYTKDVIRKQPTNLIEFSAEWFAQMSEQSRQEDPYKAAQDHFPDLRKTLQEMDSTQSGVLAKEQIVEACLGAGLSETTLESVFSLGKFEDQIDWRQFLVLAMAFMCESEMAAVELMFSVFDDNGILPTDFLLMLIDFLLAHDSQRPREYLQQLAQQIKATEDGRFAEQITFPDFARVPLAAQLN
ncbi:putative radial spoke protein 11 [Paratrimastix pyriformis]|uniref:Radial spoke protein 11 n=1 Tax=Paratrimastix pyriformis TaxID=342808 RepID=A0ABQ8UMA9_9EUKA|nr:putative radial spoke protein 11 [Paratrimastix pyriformis]|eukprot:GAFH01003998.1.p1 GENE.GAFH01003998.1~~GAFH01003998.1.p1  ORF type:complete len:238 (+),score=47.56 GAFH01003998.1:26-715(+)